MTVSAGGVLLPTEDLTLGGVLTLEGSGANLVVEGTASVAGAMTVTGALTQSGASTVTGILTGEAAIVGESTILSSSPTAGVGYAAGAGGAVTQITSAVTGVTLNTVTGAITTFALDQVAGVDFSFVLTNSVIEAGDLVIVHTKTYGGTADGIPVAQIQSVAAGSCIINVVNQGAVALDALAVISFAVIKGQIA